MTSEELYKKEFGNAKSISKKSVISLLNHFGKVLEMKNAQIKNCSIPVAYEAIKKVKDMYPNDIFPEDGETSDCKSAVIARITCDNIKRELDEAVVL